jgi:hypothetical protein
MDDLQYYQRKQAEIAALWHQLVIMREQILALHEELPPSNAELAADTRVMIRAGASMTNLICSSGPGAVVAAVGGSNSFVTLASPMGTISASGILQQPFGGVGMTGLGASAGCNTNRFGTLANAGAGPQGTAQDGLKPPSIAGITSNN